MKTITNIIAGLTGALALNIVHEVARKYQTDAPHINEIGEDAIEKGIKATGNKPPTRKVLYAAALGADLLSNTCYYSMIGKNNIDNVWYKGLFYGLSAGLGTIMLTKPLGFNDAPVNRTTATKLMTMGWYTLGGLATAGALKLLRGLQYKSAQ